MIDDSGGESVQLCRAQPQKCNQVTRGAERIGDRLVARGRKRSDDCPVTFRHENGIGRNGAVDEMCEPQDCGRIAGPGGANGDLAPTRDLACEGCRKMLGHPRYLRPRADSSIRESLPAKTDPRATRMMKTSSAISMVTLWLSRYYQHKSMFS